jgi:hypothetical protein
MDCPSSAPLLLPRRPRRKPSNRPYNAHCVYNLVTRTWIAFSAVHCAKHGRTLRRPANTTCWPGGTHRRFRPCNRYLSKLRDNVITTGSITATAAADSSSGGTGLSSNQVTSDRKRPTAARRTDRNGPKEIGGGKDEDRERTPFAIAAVNPGTSQWIAHTHLRAKRLTRGKRRRAKARLSASSHRLFSW